ncbi:MAG: WYL domain-containing protein, partial [Desulfobacteraceae bacterium]|nr:WYL domain-containing protein [Desulfobacteraceae bacterium]
VDVTEPDEVLWWSLQWGPGAEIIEPEWLRRKAEKTIYEMSKLYENEEGVPKV